MKWFIEFIFSSFWVFVGMIVLISYLFDGICNVIKTIFQRKSNEKHNYYQPKPAEPDQDRN